MMDYLGEVDLHLSGTCVAFGEFDGVHTGHRAVINQVLQSSGQGLKSVILCFERQSEGKVLSTKEEKQALLEAYHPDVLITCKTERREIDETFIRDVLVSRLGAKTVVAGKENKNLPLLRACAEKYGYALQECETVRVNGEPVTSEGIAKDLSEGSLEAANEMLGHPYSLLGRVVHGKALGRTVGMPTANLGVSPQKLVPRHGVYATTTVIDGKSYKGMTNIGRRPSVDDFQYDTIETFLLDFSQDIYDREINLEVRLFVRDVLKLNSLAEVQRQVGKDIEYVRKHITF